MGRSLGQMQSELRSIINELESIASGIGSNFKGIGAEQCSSKLQDFIEECEASIKHLDHIKEVRREEKRKERERQQKLEMLLNGKTMI
ncbi:hypothetical protein SFC08_10480 [Lysinibacillus halotolerans]|uniref:Uncharacterized protein n=1 Tax=Ureibacillus galli TaxID=2762222 RepID=A0ABR8XCE2_9BACL|nr:hypothetical protein [Ureibacillus galli]MBD8026902.1 hypothetical protein [Ureibacillus galli]